MPYGYPLSLEALCATGHYGIELASDLSIQNLYLGIPDNNLVNFPQSLNWKV